MKLIVCTECGDVVSLIFEWRQCKCGKSEGIYLDRKNAKIKGPCIPLGFENISFIDALRNQPEQGMGKPFSAFVIPKQCPSIVVEPDSSGYF